LERTDLSADDRSSLYDSLIDVQPDEAHKKALAAQWLAFLEGEAKKASTPFQRSAFDAHRLSAARALGEPGRAVPALEESERELADDYNAPARLAVALRAMGKLDEALAATGRALAHVYGPRRLRIDETRIDLFKRKNDLAGAKRAWEEAMAATAQLPE